MAASALCARAAERWAAMRDARQGAWLSQVATTCCASCILLLACQISWARIAPCAPRIPTDLPAYVERTTVIALARVSSSLPNDEYSETVTLKIEKVFKGDLRRHITLRYTHGRATCRDLLPRGARFYLFLSHEGIVHLPSAVSFITLDEAPPEFEAQLGRGRRPRSGPDPTPFPLAPPDVPRERVTRTERDIVEESWTVALQEIRDWTVPRFYVRLSGVVVFFDPDYVRAVAPGWGDADLLNGVMRALPLTEPTDLYRYTLMGRYPRGTNDRLERFVETSLLSGRAALFDPLRRRSAREIKVVRTSLGTQSVQLPGGSVILQERVTYLAPPAASILEAVPR
jgi:hypothetical protein